MNPNRSIAAIALIGHVFVVSLSGQNVFPSSGNVGIGTTSPGKALVVNGTVGIGPEELPLQATNFGYSNTYKVLRLGLDQATRTLALNVDPAMVTGGNFSGNGQILIGNRGILAPDAAGSNWMGVLRASGGKVFVGGTLDAGDLVGSSLVVNGNSVGIGTASPANPLEVRGVARFSNGTDYGWIFAGSSGGLNAFHVGSFTNVPLSFFTNGSAPKMTIDVVGHVGIGTTSPTSTLHSVGIVSIAKGGVNYISDNSATMRLGRYDNEAGSALGYIQAPYNENIQIWNHATQGIAEFKNNRDSVFYGNVGIGTTNPSHKLAVNGTIRAKEVIVDTGWADHVFAADYRLAPLSEVEQHIQQNGHLPDVPSAADVAAQGVSVGEMQKILLQKIEELTLHVIRLEKENSALQRRVQIVESKH